MSERDQQNDESDLIRRLRDGDDAAFRWVLDEYGDALHRLAERKLGAELRHRLGPEDVVQSVCRTFFRRAKQGEFELSDTESLWRLLCVITVVKTREKRRFHTRQRRSVYDEEHLDSVAPGGEPLVPPPSITDPAPDEVVEFADQLEHIVSALEPEERQILDFKLQGFDNGEVADRLECSQRTVRRMMQNVRTHLERYFDDD